MSEDPHSSEHSYARSRRVEPDLTPEGQKAGTASLWILPRGERLPVRQEFEKPSGFKPRRTERPEREHQWCEPPTEENVRRSPRGAPPSGGVLWRAADHSWAPDL